MRAISAQVPGGPEVLAVAEHEVPRPGEGEVLIRVVAAGVNRPDCLQRKGVYPPPPGVTDILGLEVAGEIVALGDGVALDLLGLKVMALIAGGGYAEYAVAPIGSVIEVPEGMPSEVAAAFPETFFTVWHNVFQRAKLQSGETFMVHGGTSGIGTTAIQLAKAFGAKVIATAGSVAKCEACMRLGADTVVNYRESDFVEVVKEVTGGRGVDVTLDMVGGPYVSRNYKAAAVEGRIVQIAFLQGAKVEADISKLMIKRLTHTGSTLRARSEAFKAVIADELKEQVLPLISSGQIAPVMDSTFALEDAAKAHARMEEGAHIGKIVLTI
ncbi:MAG: zinc-binding dehydrogenase [Boseongicola sp.]|nr:MAG: zinc-binding dehydrogenase [Boseongicola sp.]